jgi:sugar lactone lactonase YvrE
VTTLAGSAGAYGSADGTGSAARFSAPWGVAVDSAGSVFVADTSNHTIRKVTPAGVVTTLAGSAGHAGSTDGTGSAARFNYPASVAVDSAGSVFVADSNNRTIRMVTPAGVVTTLAGSAGSIGSADGTGNVARFSSPQGVAVDSAGNVFVADSGNQMIRKVTPAGVVTTLAGSAGSIGSVDGTGSAARFNYPSSVAVDSAGNVFVADTYNHAIRKVTAARVVTTIGGVAGVIGGADGLGSSANFDFPSGIAVDSAGNLYVTDGSNNAVRKGWPTSGAVGVSITVPPQSQTANAGATVAFNVAATGTGQLSYQWLFNGANIPGATDATLSFANAQLGNAGGYSVIVSSPYGSASSATASLAVLTDGANGNTPARITPQPVPSKPSGANNLVFVTHGCQLVELNLTGPPTSQPWMVAMTNDIVQQLVASGQSSAWQVEAYYWLTDAWTLLPDTALNKAKVIGTQLGKQFAAQGWQHVHLIAHSAGSGLIQAIADQLKSSLNPPRIQLTFLDPYLGAFLEEQSVYGQKADWSDCYSVEDGTGGFTSGNLNNAFNVDVSWVDPAHIRAPYISPSGGEVALSSHEYPHDFYSQSITDADPNWCAKGYGFALSKEVEGVFWLNNQAIDPVGSGPFLPCSPADAVKNPNPGVAGIEAGAVGAWVFISGVPHALSNAGASLVGDAGFELNSVWSALKLVKSGGVHPLDNTNSSTTPAWLAVGVAVTNPVNFIQFDAGFTDTNAAEGLLTVYWNTNQIGMVDERVASPGRRNYRFVLPGTVASGIYTLSFRLDSFASSSTIAVTNVATGFVGVTQPIMLGISLTNRAPLLQLTGPPGYNYLLQTSTNLADWTPTTLLANPHGTVVFADSAVTNHNRWFYRAVILSSMVAAPLLHAQVFENSFILSWPAWATGYALETSTSLKGTSSWAPVTNVPAIVDSQYTVTNAVSGGSRFYRLRSP